MNSITHIIQAARDSDKHTVEVDGQIPLVGEDGTQVYYVVTRGIQGPKLSIKCIVKDDGRTRFVSAYRLDVPADIALNINSVKEVARCLGI